MRLLSAVDYYEDAAFNALQLDDLLADVGAWREYEQHRGDPEQRLSTIEHVESVLAAANKARCYVIFLSL